MAHRLLQTIVLLSLVATATAALPAAQIQYSWPLRAGGELGVNFFEGTGFMLAAGPFVSASAGRDGLGLNAGCKGAFEFLFLPYATAGIGASGLYLWEGSDATFAGVRGSLSFSLLSVFSGVYGRLSGDGADDWIISLGAGVGLP